MASLNNKECFVCRKLVFLPPEKNPKNCEKKPYLRIFLIKVKNSSEFKEGRIDNQHDDFNGKRQLALCSHR